MAGRRRGPLGLWFSLAGVVLLAVAVAGPAASLPVGRSAGTVILAMDVSNSMSADDVAPSRLAAAQQAAAAFIDAQPDTVDIGVVGFDQGALTTSLPSADRAAAKAAVQNLRISGGRRSPRPSSAHSARSRAGRSRSARTASCPTSGTGARPPSC